jgi:hypothetical protein
MDEGDGSHRFNPEGQIVHRPLYPDELPGHARHEAFFEVARD